MAGVGEFHVLHLDARRAEGGHQPPRLRDRDHVVQGAVEDQEGSGPRVDPGERRRVRAADGFSGWLLAVRARVSTPDARWDRLLYGIHDVEVFLRST